MSELLSMSIVSQNREDAIQQARAIGSKWFGAYADYTIYLGKTVPVTEESRAICDDIPTRAITHFETVVEVRGPK